MGRRFLGAMAARHPAVRVRALVHRTHLPALDMVEPVDGRLDDEESLVPPLRGVDTVIHFAASTHASKAERYFTTNTAGTANLVRASQRAGVRRFILISTRAIRSECGDYARSKAAAEAVVRTSGLPHVILRFAEVYGGGSSEGLNALLDLVRKSPLVPCPVGGASLSPLWVDDAVDAVSRVVVRPDLPKDVYTIAGPRSYTLPQIIGIVAHRMAKRRLIVPIPLTLLPIIACLSTAIGGRRLRYDQISRLKCEKDSDIDDARRDLEFTPLAFEEGVKRFLSEEC